MLNKEFIEMWPFQFSAICIFLSHLEILAKIISLCCPGIFQLCSWNLETYLQSIWFLKG